MGQSERRLGALFLPRDLAPGDLVTVPEEEAQHARALRLRVGDELLLLDGRGGRSNARVESIDRRRMELRVQSRVLDRVNGGPYIALAVGLLSDRGRFEWIVEKATELGVSEIVPLQTERSEGRYQAERCSRVAISALKQSQRSFLPILDDPLSLGDLLGRTPEFDHTYLCHEDVPPSADALLAGSLVRNPSSMRILLLVGPEGGFSAGEVEVARGAAGALSVVSLGEARLRAETAALASLVLATNIVNLLHRQSNE